MKKIFLFWLFIGWVCIAKSQTITITDFETGKPLEMVVLMSEKPKAVATTNDKGMVDITPFRGSENILFSHAQYKEASYSYKAIEVMRFRVIMERKIITLEKVSVSAQRWEQKAIESPSRVATISMREATFQNPQTAADLLGVSGYAFIQKSQLGGGSPMLRGMATNRVLLVVDGVRMNTAIFRSGNLQNVISLDANSIENTEILFGPGSVMYGSDAIGGVMSFNTLKPVFADTLFHQTKVTGNAMTRFSSANQEKTNHIDFNIGLKKVALTTSFTHANYDDLRSGTVGGDPYFYRPYYVLTFENDDDHMIFNRDSALQVGSKYSQINFMQKVRYRHNKYWDIDYGFHFSETSKYNRYDRLYVMRTDGPYKDKLRWADWYYGPQKWQMHRFGISGTNPTLLYDKANFVAAYQFFEESRYDREFKYKELRMQKENVDALSLNLDLTKNLTEKTTMYYGGELVHNTIHSVATLTNVFSDLVDSTLTRYPDGSTWQSIGGYVTAKYKITSKWLLNGGMRYNSFVIKADFDTTFFPFPFLETKMNSGSLSGSLGVVFTPDKSWQIFFNGANGFRAPNVDDMGKVFESVPGYLVVPNPDLKPEKVYNLELGTVKTFGDFLKIDATAYYTWLVDAMVRKDFVFNGDTTIRFLGNKSRIQAVQNVTEIDVYGIQAGVELFYRNFGLTSHLSYQKGREQTPDSLVYYPLRHAAPTFGSTHIMYEYRNKFKVDFYVVYNAKMDHENLALTERTNRSYARDENGMAYVAAWHTFNLKAAYFPHPFITLTAGVENIADRMFRPYASGINAPGRNFILSIRVKF